jgi:hypothetical protein
MNEAVSCAVPKSLLMTFLAAQEGMRFLLQLSCEQWQGVATALHMLLIVLRQIDCTLSMLSRPDCVVHASQYSALPNTSTRAMLLHLTLQSEEHFIHFEGTMRSCQLEP